jgi:CBS domain-containing protein
MMMAPSDGYPDAMSHRHRAVADVMTTSVVTADRLTPYKEIARLLAEHRISGLPVLVAGWQVVGVVSEADLLEAQDTAARQASIGTDSRICRVRAPRHPSLTASELMTAPPVTIHPDATIPAAMRAMNAHHVRRLPVTGADHQLIGIVSRRDLLSVFLRPDTDIIHDVRRVLDEIPLTHPAGVIVTVRHGVVTIAGTIQPATGDPQDLIPLVTRLIWDVDGVVDVVTRLREVKDPSLMSHRRALIHRAGRIRRPVTRDGTMRTNSSFSPPGQGSTPAATAAARSASASTWCAGP